MARLSIIIPIYGVEKYVERCCVSVFEQSFQDFELILVNDCSKDGSEKLVLDVVERYKHLSIQTKYIKHDVNKGISAARETGTNAATGEYILYIDSDDYIASNMLECMIAKANENQADVVYCDYYEVKNGELNFCDQSVQPNTAVDVTAAMLAHKIVWSPWNKIFKRSILLLNDIHWPCGINVGEDMVVLTMVFAYANTIVHVDKPLYFYNRDNVNSYLNGWNQSSCEQHLKGVALVNSFINTKFNKPILLAALIQTKLMARYQILYSFNSMQFNLVANTFAETNDDIFNYKKTGWHWKCLMYMVAHRNFWLSRMLLIAFSKLKGVSN